MVLLVDQILNVSSVAVGCQGVAVWLRMLILALICSQAEYLLSAPVYRFYNIL